MEHVDGNAIAGPLAEFFAFDVTTATGRCVGCGSIAELARAMVYRSGAGTVVRCARATRCSRHSSRAAIVLGSGSAA